MYQRKIEQELRCPLEYGINLLNGKWRSRIICMLENKKSLRFSEIKSNLINVTDGVLATTLIEMTKMSLIDKCEDVSNGIYEYRITEKGKSLIPILQSMCQWASKYYSKSSEVVMTQCLDCEFYKNWKNKTN